jgi:hypothetical protein
MRSILTRPSIAFGRSWRRCTITSASAARGRKLALVIAFLSSAAIHYKRE